MHVDVVPNRNARPTYLLRESFREGARVRKRTLANLSSLPDEQIEAIRAVLRGEALCAPGALFEVFNSRPHGHVHAVEVAMQRLGIATLLAARGSRQRDLACAMIAARVLAPRTKLATTRWWHSTTLAEQFGVADADEDELYGAMDWLLAHQGTIEKKLAARHLAPDAMVLFDLTSSYFEGTHCPLGRLGYSRDGVRGKLQVNWGLLTDARGCPVAVSVFEGNTADAQTLLPQLQRVREQFGVGRAVIVGDRGMVSHKAIEQLRESEAAAWITALKSVQIRALVEQGSVQLGLFDERNLFEFTAAQYPGERLVACRNPALATLRAAKRQALLAGTEQELLKIQSQIKDARLRGADRIGVRVGRVINKYKVAKHFDLTINDEQLQFAVNAQRVLEEAALDGIYIVRTSLGSAQMDGAQVVRSYKQLAHVERGFRTLKGFDLQVRPIHHRLADRVRAHILLCVLAYYVQWHMRQAWRSMLFDDEDVPAKATRDPVAPAQRSASALRKAATLSCVDGTPVHSFATLLHSLSTIVRNTCKTPGTPEGTPGFTVLTTPDAQQRRALELLESIAA